MRVFSFKNMSVGGVLIMVLVLLSMFLVIMGRYHLFGFRWGALVQCLLVS